LHFINNSLNGSKQSLASINLASKTKDKGILRC